MIHEQTLAAAGDDWRAKISELQALLDEIKPRLITAESELAERLAAISAFEFRLRARLGSLSRRLDELDNEIRALRRQLRALEDDWFYNDADFRDQPLRDSWGFDAADGAAASGSFRYRAADAGVAPPQTLTAAESETLKKLYRRLARRFHPDFGLDEADRAYRTQIMMAVNAAYAAGDLARLEQLAEEPEHAAATTFTDEALAQALFNELLRCRRRLEEIGQELAQLERHRSAELMRRAARAAETGRDLLAEMAADLREQIAHKLVTRDVLKDEIAAFAGGESTVGADALADAVFDLGLERLYEDDSETTLAAWRDRHWQHLDLHDDSADDDEWRAIRKATGRKKRF